MGLQPQSLTFKSWEATVGNSNSLYCFQESFGPDDKHLEWRGESSGLFRPSGPPTCGAHVRRDTHTCFHMNYKGKAVLTLPVLYLLLPVYTLRPLGVCTLSLRKRPTWSPQSLGLLT